ncbi:hypothetical protein CKO31_25515, partial [Thiohalocapsa halophila]|nr:hypothetical protein [Thiohalocapsa halophila]
RWLGTAANSTAQLLDRLDSLRVAMDETLQQREGLLWLRYPDWFDTAAWPAAEAAQSLSDDGLLEPDPRTPMRRVRDHAGERWLVLNAEVSRHLGVLLDGSGLAQAASAPESAQGGAAPASSADGAADPDREPTGDDARSLIEVILRDLGAQSEPRDGSHTQILDHATLKTLAKQHRLGV